MSKTFYEKLNKRLNNAPEFDARTFERIYVLADCHLGVLDSQSKSAAIGNNQRLVQQLQSLEQNSLLIVLGDLFVYWFGNKKFWTPSIELVLNAFKQLQTKGITTLLVVGNRDLFIPSGSAEAGYKDLPYALITQEFLTIKWSEQVLGFAHGDLINPYDRHHIRWTRLIRTIQARKLVNLLPKALVGLVAYKTEQSLAHINQYKRGDYPHHALERFAEMLPQTFDQFFLGHFHHQLTIQPPQRKVRLNVVKPWLETGNILVIKKQLRLEYI